MDIALYVDQRHSLTFVPLSILKLPAEYHIKYTFSQIYIGYFGTNNFASNEHDANGFLWHVLIVNINYVTSVHHIIRDSGVNKRNILIHRTKC